MINKMQGTQLTEFGKLGLLLTPPPPPKKKKKTEHLGGLVENPLISTKKSKSKDPLPNSSQKQRTVESNRETNPGRPRFGAFCGAESPAWRHREEMALALEGQRPVTGHVEVLLAYNSRAWRRPAGRSDARSPAKGY